MLALSAFLGAEHLNQRQIVLHPELIAVVQQLSDQCLHAKAREVDPRSLLADQARQSLCTQGIFVGIVDLGGAVSEQE